MRVILTRLWQSIVVLLGMSFLCFILIGLMPGDPIDIMIAANPEATAEDAARLRAIHGLDKPLGVRYLGWLQDAAKGDFGYSRLFSKPALEIILDRIWPTLALMAASLTVALLIAFPAGIYAAVRKDSMIDRLINLTCFAGMSIPSFWLALLLISGFAVSLNWLPAGGFAPEGSGIGTSFKHLILPIIALSVASIAGYTRYIRSAMIESLAQDHIRTARAKGCSGYRTVMVHGLRGALAPVCTVIALDFGTLFSGALVTETVFARPGMGKLIYDAILGNDFNLALLALLIATVMILVGNMVADVITLKLDPRIRLDKSQEGTA